MKNFRKKIICALALILIISNGAFANSEFATHYNQAQEYLSQYQYSSAISEFKRALRINYMDNSARIGLTNAYMARGTYLANTEKNWNGAANDFRAAIFYLRYYPTSNQDIQNAMSAIASATNNLNQCLSMAKFDTSAKSRFNKGKSLRYQGFFPEAGYEFCQTLLDPNLRKDSYEQIGDIMKVLGNDQKSAEYYEKAVALDKNNASIRLKYARVLDRIDKNDLAVNEYNYALANGSNDPEILYALERIYRKKLEQSPNDASTITNLGAILQKENKLDEALQYYTKAGQIEPTNVTTRLNLGTLYQQKKSYDAAIAAYDSILLLHPDNVQALLYKAQCQSALGQKEDSILTFKKVLSMQPNNQEAIIQVKDSMKETLSPSEYMAYLSQNPTSENVAEMYDYAIDLHKQKRFDEAITCYEEVLKYDKNNPEVFVNIAIAYKQKGETNNAKTTLNAAKTRFPSNKQILDNLKAINDEELDVIYDNTSKEFNNGNFQKALSIYQSVQPATFDSNYGIAACYRSLENNDKAIEYYKKALSLHSDSEVSYYIGVLYSEKENWLDSRSYLKKALTINPKNQHAKDLLASVEEQANVGQVDKAIDLFEKGQYAQAEAILNKVLVSDPKNSYAYYYKGLIKDNNKKYALAIEDYKKAIIYNPTLTVIYYLLAIDYDSLSQFKSALTYYKKYVTLTTDNNEYKKYSQGRIKDLQKYAAAK